MTASMPPRPATPLSPHEVRALAALESGLRRTGDQWVRMPFAPPPPLSGSRMLLVIGGALATILGTALISPAAASVLGFFAVLLGVPALLRWALRRL